MEQLEFGEYWFVILERNPDFDRSNEDKLKSLMTKHFEFIDQQLASGNLFVAIPFSSGGLYCFDGKLSEEYMNQLLEEEESIKGAVFLSDLKRAFVPAHHLYFTLESKKKIDEFHQKRKDMQNT